MWQIPQGVLSEPVWQAEPCHRRKTVYISKNRGHKRPQGRGHLWRHRQNGNSREGCWKDVRRT